MTFPLDFDLLVIGVCTFIQKKKQRQRQKKQKNKTKKTKKKRVQRYVCVSYLTPSVFVVGFIIGGLSEIL